MSTLKLSFLGSFRAELDGRSLSKAFRTEKERALFAYLVVEANRSFTRETLAELFWPDRPNGVARTSLRQALAGIRKALADASSLPPYLLLSDHTLQFNLDKEHSLDVNLFQELFHSSMAHRHESLDDCPMCVARLEEAIQLYRGNFLEDFYQVESLGFREWLTCNREQYFRLLLTGLQYVSSFYETRGDLDTAISYIQRWINFDPLDESARRKLMYLFAASGRRGLALDQYQACVKILSDELGVGPSRETISLHKKIKEGEVVLVHKGRGPVDPFPSDLTSFVGRQTELARAASCLEDPVCRLLSFIGIPGSGKTRLVLKIAALNKDKFEDGACYFNLEKVKPADFYKVVADGLSLSLSQAASPARQILAHLISQKTLLIFDPFDHFLAKTAFLVDILQKAPGVKILVTSRERLNFQAACLFEINGLPFPENPQVPKVEDFPAIKLFVNRAIQTRPCFTLHEKNLPNIVKICRHTEGNPLAIELAATNLKRFTCGQLADSIGASAQILTTDLQDVPERHRSLQKILDEFWGCLNASESQACLLLSEFPDRFSFKDVQDNPGLSNRILGALLNKSFLQKDKAGFFHMPLLIHRFAQEKREKEALNGLDGSDKAKPPVAMGIHDELTGLLNPPWYFDRLAHAVVRATRHRVPFGVMVVSFGNGWDRLKNQPDERNQVLKIAASRLKACLRESETIARLTDDEIGLIVEDVGGVDGCKKVAEKVLAALTANIEINDEQVCLPVKIGVSIFPQAGSDPEILVRQARCASNRVKSGYLFSHPDH
jgi:diguanylate cyclase (GGDEF)-like protein